MTEMQNPPILIQNGRVIDPASGRDGLADVLVRDGVIAAVGERLEIPEGAETVDGSGKVVVPGFIDIHVHLREPGREDKENIASGTRAAAAGGFTSVCPMPNTTPVCDDAQGIQFLRARAQDTAVVHVLPVAAVTEGQMGESITEFGDLVYYGAVAFSDDGRPIMNAEIMRRALEYTSMFNVPVLDHCEDLNLSHGGQMRSGALAAKLGLKGIPDAAVSSQVARDVDLAAYTGGHVHIQHVSVRQAVEAIRAAKTRGVRVTAEATPHHLTLTDEAVGQYDTNMKMSPPLGSEEDRRALIEGLKSGAIDCIATDHAPHTDMEKDQVFDLAPNGVIGMETAFATLYDRLVLKGEIDLPLLIEKLTVAPARVLNLPVGRLVEGSAADLAILDLELEKQVDPNRFYSRSRNCPFNGEVLKGWPVATMVSGRFVFRDGEMLV